MRHVRIPAGKSGRDLSSFGPLKDNTLKLTDKSQVLSVR